MSRRPDAAQHEVHRWPCTCPTGRDGLGSALWESSATVHALGSSLRKLRFCTAAEQARDESHTHQIRQARRVHLGHDIGPVNLDRARTDAQVVCDDLVGVSAHQAVQDLTLPARKSRELFLDRRAFRVAPAVVILARQRRTYRSQKCLVVERLLEKVDGTKLHRLHGKGNVAVPGDHNDRQCDLALSQVPQEIYAIELGHPNVRDDASARGKAAQELHRAVIRLDLDVGRTKEEFERLPHGFIVVDHMHDGLRRRHHRPPPYSRSAA